MHVRIGLSAVASLCMCAQEFDQGCMCTGNVDNDASGNEKVRILSPQGRVKSEFRAYRLSSAATVECCVYFAPASEGTTSRI